MENYHGSYPSSPSMENYHGAIKPYKNQTINTISNQAWRERLKPTLTQYFINLQGYLYNLE